MKKILSIIILWACCSFSYAQFPWGYVIGNAIGTTIRQQVINAQQREYQRQAQERERKRQAELEAQRERERKANEIHESAQYETGGYQWTRFYKGTSATVYGAKDKNGKELIPLSRNYTYIYFQPEEGAKGYFKVKKNDKYGACDLTGKEVVSCAYDGIMYFKGAFCYKGTDGEYHDLDVALDNEGKGRKPDPDRLVDKTKKTESDGYVWYATYNTGKKDDIYNRHGARSIDNRKIVPENYSLVYYLNGYFVAKKNDIDFNELYNANGVRVLEQNRQYCIAEIHADQGWAKVSRNAPSGKMVGAIDLRTSKEIVPMQASCMIRYNTSSKRFETKKEKETTWKKTTYSLDTQGVTISATQSSLSGTASSSSNSSNSTTTTSYDFNPGLYPNGGLIIDNSFNGGTTNQTEIQQPVRQPQRQWCRTCGGTGNCNTCGGSGWVHRTGIGHDSYCPNCPNHNGKCPWCNGRGEWYE